MQVIFGVIYHFIVGFASGSFYIPYKKVKGWSWESYWIVCGIFSWLIVLPLAAYLTIPGFTDIVVATDGSILGLIYFFGVLWGIGGLTYGLGPYLGVSMGSSIILGLCSVFGTLIPSVYTNFYPSPGKDSITDLINSSWGQMVLLGILICIIGIIICGKAGMMKEKDLGSSDKTADNSEFKIGLGLFVSIFSDILSAGFEDEQQVKRIADHFNANSILFRMMEFEPDIINLKYYSANDAIKI